ncbi:hypothetical protein KR222_000269, partial [Zaprionus bogoriensis]
SGYSESRHRRPKSEILRELRRLSSQPTPAEGEDDELDEMLAPPPSKPVRSLEQLDALRLTRHRIEQLLHCVNFEQAVRNCFVRLNINAPNQTPEYRIAEIMGVEELSEGYYVGKTPTNIALHLRFEDLLERHELNDISNMAFTREEFDLWHDNCICQAIAWPTTDLIARKKLEIYNALNSETKSPVGLPQTKGLLPLTIPIRPPPRGGLLERVGGVYPWKLQRPTPPTPPVPATPELNPLSAASDADADADDGTTARQPVLELEQLN